MYYNLYQINDSKSESESESEPTKSEIYFFT